MQIKNGDKYLTEVRKLIEEYVTRLGRDLSFQKIEDEINNLEMKYLPPYGEILVAVEDRDVIGMVAYHKLDSLRCEMKRFYVIPNKRQQHVGEKLVSAIISKAQNAGYQTMFLDTITPFQAAIHLYKKHGFDECEPYYSNPMEDVVYMRLEL